MAKFFDKIKENKWLRYIIIVILIGILAFFLFSTTQPNKENQNQNKTVDDYVTNLEYKLSKTLSLVDGAGDVSVVITVESGMETVLAMKTTTNKTSQGEEIVETPVLVNGKTVVVKELNPKIIGVLIVAKGGNNIGVLSKLQQATISLLDINVNQIEILTMK